MFRAPFAAVSTSPAAANGAIAASSVAPVASGYEHSLRPCADTVFTAVKALPTTNVTLV